ncbi:MAG: pyridoxal phosphate-dependent aminotransferase [Candidatus Omnitrophica bacterium]|nr:pyridoxal phosphate-dependent aminotransferase [Candidatus Omnitrophota bacterium]
MPAFRTNWKFSPNRLTSHLQALKQSGINIIDLSESNSTRLEFNYLKADLLTPLVNPRNLFYEPDPKGMLEARSAVQSYYLEKKVNVPLDHIFLTASTSEAYSFLLRLLTNAGERALVPRPSYPLFDFLADLNDISLDSYSLRYEEGAWQIDLESLARELRVDTKAIILVNPNNPTGSFVKQIELEKIAALARKHSLALIADEVFSDYFFGEDSMRVTTLAQISDVVIFTLGGISKMLGLPQMKLGWIVANGPSQILNPLLERLEIILDTYLSVNTPVQRALAPWFSLKPSIQKEIKDRIQTNFDFLQGFPTSCLQTEGGWYAILNLPQTQSDEDWALEFLDRDHVYLHPGYFFGLEEAHAVVSLLVPHDQFKEGISRILTRIKRR